MDADLPSTDRAIRSVTSPFTQSHRGQALFSTQGKEGNIQSLVPAMHGYEDSLAVGA